MLTLDLPTFPVLETDRLRLRQTTLDDVQPIFSMRSSAIVMQYIPVPLATDVKEAEDYIHSLDERMKNKECLNWSITLKETGEMIGTMGFYRMQLQHYRTEVGYMLLPAFYGKGYASEALQRLVDFGLNNLGFHSLEAVIYPENKGSIRVVEKCGFVREAYFKDKEYHNGKFVDTAIYSKVNH
ncbi:GNAT family N-acetyltransferase [Myroides sp. DF42-4-2]|uniref:GNAT family N-acetyltransferase n=1 Tax=unclassified Myroides TaxID=2642485 RepID=UPI002577C592|nr:GNAT family N-acetyltransferase [Myroides sp. DF42-4-2]MDM1406259.1 GNAT family N-acetyltransferase [Myroides sp. DF42-4-2]